MHISGTDPGWAKQKVTLAKLTSVEGWENEVGAGKNSQKDEHIKHHSIDVDISTGEYSEEAAGAPHWSEERTLGFERWL